ncbi:hypothetical protein [Virgisporangium aurantiacum]|jgi:hypothetical protein|uniref:Uncharacterized protein n=1 Tax=Virgisporangium aurantiacum TaxID=175570 RepID=A0A8J3Z0P4_9ACTN|nr:hypothetical protein [Virgisporangium aurantiacum]GIJ53091.1 hypothetical protein Vau01_006070 [Virgisporangium aurantiacum]
MAVVTADDLRVLAQSDDPEAVLAVVNNELRVVPGFEVTAGQVILTKVQLVEELGEDITDVDAEVLAAGLTAKLPTD